MQKRETESSELICLSVVLEQSTWQNKFAPTLSLKGENTDAEEEDDLGEHVAVVVKRIRFESTKLLRVLFIRLGPLICNHCFRPFKGHQL